jgi:hypothetical protein
MSTHLNTFFKASNELTDHSTLQYFSEVTKS